MRILFFSSAHNSLSQRLFVELRQLGHQVDVTIASSEEAIVTGFEQTQPELIIAPMLKKRIPDFIWNKVPCFIVHPGIVGDRGPSSLDWAILDGEMEWGVTVLQAAAELDGGDIWATENFAMRSASKSSIYRRDVTQAAAQAALRAVRDFDSGSFVPGKLDYSDSNVKGRVRPRMMQADRRIDWGASTDDVLRKMRASDSAPGISEIRCRLGVGHYRSTGSNDHVRTRHGTSTLSTA